MHQLPIKTITSAAFTIALLVVAADPAHACTSADEPQWVDDDAPLFERTEAVVGGTFWLRDPSVGALYAIDDYAEEHPIDVPRFVFDDVIGIGVPLDASVGDVFYAQGSGAELLVVEGDATPLEAFPSLTPVALEAERRQTSSGCGPFDVIPTAEQTKWTAHVDVDDSVDIRHPNLLVRVARPSTLVNDDWHFFETPLQPTADWLALDDFDGETLRLQVASAEWRAIDMQFVDVVTGEASEVTIDFSDEEQGAALSAQGCSQAGVGAAWGLLLFALVPFCRRRRQKASLQGASLFAVGGVALFGAPQAGAFCGMIVAEEGADIPNATGEVAIVRVGNKTTITMNTNYKGDPSQFALVVPVPKVLKRRHVRTIRRRTFQLLDEVTAPLHVEFLEADPCGPYQAREYGRKIYYPRRRRRKNWSMPPSRLGLIVTDSFRYAEYSGAIVSGHNAKEIELWLRDDGYSLPQGAAPVLEFYSKRGMNFLVVTVDLKKLRRKPDGSVLLAPLQFSFTSPKFELPIQLGMLNSTGTQNLIVYAITERERVTTTNYPNVFFPAVTNLGQDVFKDEFGRYYRELVAKMHADTGGVAVVTEYVGETGACPRPCRAILGHDRLKELGLERGKGVITRLHVQASRTLFKEDLQLAPAKYPRRILGRFERLHLWDGPVTCDNPQYGRRGRWHPQRMTGTLDGR